MDDFAPAVGLLGAYERDNFGDVLFLELSRLFLSQKSTIALSPFSHRSSSGGPYVTERYADAVDLGKLNSILTVGGEVGGTSTASAFKMSAGDDLFAEWDSMSAKAKKSMLASETGFGVSASPYIPRMSARPSTIGLPFAINSAGLSGLENLIGSRRDEAWTAVREACYVSVRDQQSSCTLDKRDIAHVLAPDLVHGLRRLADFRPEINERLALVQVKGSVLRKIGTFKFAEILSSAKSLYPYDLRLFAAGYATGHDSSALYQEVVDHFASLNKSRRLLMPEGGTSFEKAQQIAGCGVWIGTSLHGWIISSSFTRPRVALELEKIVRYATTWNDPMPVGVKVASLDSAVHAAFDIHKSQHQLEDRRADSLAEQATLSIGTAIDRLSTLVPLAETDRREQSYRRMRGAQTNFLRVLIDHAEFMRRK